MEKNVQYAGHSYEWAVDKFSDTVTRICAVRCRNLEDTKDCYQIVFLKLYTAAVEFESEEHVKSWLIKAAVTTSTDYMKQFWKRNVILNSDEHIHEMVTALREENAVEDIRSVYHDTEIMEKVLKLPLKYSQVIFLHYYEEYKISEIAQLLSQSEGTIKSQLSRGRKRLERVLIKNKQGGIIDENAV